MKKILKFIMLIGFFSMLFTGCNLDKYPPGTLPNDTPWTATTARAQWVGMNAMFRGFFYGQFSNGTDIMSDQFNASVVFGNRGGYIHQLAQNMVSDTDYVGFVWGQCYGGINLCNYFLSRIDEATDADPAIRERYAKDVRFMRAYMYYLLVKHFAPDYEPATAASDLGVPISMEVNNVSMRHARVSVDSVYRYILSELESIGSIGNTAAVNKKEITSQAYTAFKGKILLCMHRYAECVSTLKGLANDAKLTETREAFRQYWHEDLETEDYYAPNASAIEAARINGIYTNFNGTDYAADFWPTKYVTETLFNVKDTTDFRSTVYFGSGKGATDAPQSSIVYLFKFAVTDLYAVNTALHRPKAFRAGEVLLMAAEAAAHPENPSRNEVDALTYLNKLRTARGLTTLLAWSDQELKNEWAREMIGEGVRIECLKRWHEGYSGRPPQSAAWVMGGADDVNFAKREIKSDEFFRFIFPIPASEMRLNSNMKQTPGWD